MEPISIHSNQYQKLAPGSSDSADTQAYSLTLSQTALPAHADEVASVVSRSPIDRLERCFQFDNGNEYLAWRTATDAQRQAAQLGYDPALTGIEAFVIAPAGQQYGRLDDYFANQPPVSRTRLIVYKQNTAAGAIPLTDYLGPVHQDRYVGGARLEPSAISAGRALLTDLIKAYAKKQVYPVLEETHHPYAHSLGFGQTSETPHPALSTIERDLLARVELPQGYARKDFYQDAETVKTMMQDMVSKALNEVQGQDFDNASQSYGFAAELQSIYRHLCHGRHNEGIRAMNAISPYILDDLPERLFDHLEALTKPPYRELPQRPVWIPGYSKPVWIWTDHSHK